MPANPRAAEGEHAYLPSHGWLFALELAEDDTDFSGTAVPLGVADDPL